VATAGAHVNLSMCIFSSDPTYNVSRSGTNRPAEEDINGHIQ